MENVEIKIRQQFCNAVSRSHRKNHKKTLLVDKTCSTATPTALKLKLMHIYQALTFIHGLCQKNFDIALLQDMVFVFH